MRKKFRSNSEIIEKFQGPLFLVFMVFGIAFIEFIYSIAKVNSIFFYGVLLLALAPFVWRKGDDTASETGKWLAQIVKWQLALVFIFIPWYYALQLLLAHFHPPKLSTVMQVGSVQWGLFPWSLYALVAVAFLLVKKHTDSVTTLAHITMKSLPKALSSWGFIADNAYRVAANFTFCITVIVFSAFFVNRISSWYGVPLQLGFRGEYLIIFILLSAMPISERRLKWFQSHFVSKNMAGQWLALLFIFMFVTLLSVHTVCALVAWGDPASNQYLLTSFHVFDVRATDLCFYLPLWAWWFGWLRVFGGVVAEISVGRRLISVICANLLLPTLLAIWFFEYQMTHEAWPVFDLGLKQHTIILTVWVIAAMKVAYHLLTKPENVTYYALCGEVDGTDKRSSPRFLSMHRFIQGQLQLLAIYLTGFEFTYILSVFCIFGFMNLSLALILLPLFYSKYLSKKATATA